MIRSYHNIIVLTGAGISVPSGLPDYRSKNGLYTKDWEGLSPEITLSRTFFDSNTRSHFDYVLEYLYHPEATPNKAHNLLAKWEKEGHVKAVITQNIDGFHEKAGSTTIPFHGTIQYVTCHSCGSNVTLEELAIRKKTEKNYHICSKCNQSFATNVVLYGDSGYYLGGPGYADVVKLISEADLIIIAGTSLKVYPFAGLTQYKSKKCPIWIVNKEKESYRIPYDQYFQGDVVEVFESWDQE